MKPDTGCPAGWLEGWRLQDGENDHNLNSIDTAHHFYGESIRTSHETCTLVIELSCINDL